MANCESIKPKACGKGGLYIPSDNCGAVYFTGITNVTVQEGTAFDLTDEVHAYDGNGVEIPFTVEPSSIDTSNPGVYTVTYTANGVSTDRIPSYCGGQPKLHMLDCGTKTKTVTRTITVEDVSCFSFVFTPSPPIIPLTEYGKHDLRVEIRNNCDIIFTHTNLCHEGVKTIIGDYECEVDVIGMVPDAPYYSSDYFYPTVEEWVRGYKDIEYVIEAEAEGGTFVRDTVTYRYELSREAPFELSPTGIDGYIEPSDARDPFSTSIVMPVQDGTATRAVTEYIVRNVGVASGLMGVAFANMAKYSHRIVFQGDTYPGLAEMTPWEYLQYKPEAFDESPAIIEGEDVFVELNESLRGWLTLFGLPIDYPVMQGENNVYCSSHDIYDSVYAHGSIYLDVVNLPDFSESYNVIYGHNADNDNMFGTLETLRDSSVFRTANRGQLLTGFAAYDLELFAVVDCNAYDPYLYYVRKLDAQTVMDYITSGTSDINVAQLDASVATGVSKIIALSTCSESETLGRHLALYKATEIQAEESEVSP